MNNDELETGLLELPKKIANTQTEIMIYENEVIVFRLTLKEFEDTPKLSILNELVDGKKKYPNEELRDIELRKRLSGDSRYTNLLSSIKEMESKIRHQKIYLEEQLNLFSAYKAIANLRSH